jgi:hypothetical protein
MKPLRFGIYAGALWALVSLILIIASVLIGYRFAWVELDFRILSGSFLLAADALGFGESLSGIAYYADTGLPVTPLHVTACAALSFADGFMSGVIIALVYNMLTGRKEQCAACKAAYFGIAAGVTLHASVFSRSRAWHTNRDRVFRFHGEAGVDDFLSSLENRHAGFFHYAQGFLHLLPERARGRARVGGVGLYRRSRRRSGAGLPVFKISRDI